MSYTYHGTSDLIALPNRTVQTYPSGLVRVERSFICRKDQVAKYRNTIKVSEPMPFDNGAPAIDGLYIFPEPQELVRDDGFVEFRVTSYGRTGFLPTVEISGARGSISNLEATVTIAQDGSATQSEIVTQLPCVFEVYTYRRVVPREESLSGIAIAPEISARIYLTDGRMISTLQEISGNVEIANRVVPAFTSCTTTNFGRFVEWVYTYEAEGSMSKVTTRRL